MNGDSVKNPESEAQNLAPMPRAQQGQGGHPHDKDPAGQQGSTSHKARMAPRADAPPGLEQDGQGNTIPVSQRTQDDQDKARAARND